MLSLLHSFRIPFLIACALAPSLTGTAAQAAPLAELLAAETTDTGLSVTVPTGGCTQKSDFAITAGPVSNGAVAIEIRRLRQDSCKGNLPEGAKLVFTWGDLKLPAQTRLLVKNRVGAPAPGKRAVAPVWRLVRGHGV